MLLAGNCNGYFETGRFHRYASGTPGEHLPLNVIMPEICTAMGFPHDSFGDYGGNLPLIRA